MSCKDIDSITTRLSSSTTMATKAHRHDYNAQDEHVQYCRIRDPKFHPKRTVSLSYLEEIISRLTRPTVASTCNRWDFNNQDGNLYFLKRRDSRVRLPYMTQGLENDNKISTKAKISVSDLPFFDRSKSHRGKETWRS